MLEQITRIWKTKEIRNNILFVLGLLFIYRLVAHIPIPGVNLANLQQLLDSNGFFGLLNVFSGGGIQNFSVLMLGVAPYITASIIFQLLAMLVPRLEELSKDGEQGRQKINQYTRWLTVPLAALQTIGMITLLSSQSSLPIITDLTRGKSISIVLSVTAGTIFLMWLGELISEKKVGNGISLLIFAGIITALPTTVQRIVATYDGSQLMNIILFAVLSVLTIVAIVFITEGQRNIPINHGRQARIGNMYGSNQSSLPLRVNQAGVIPIIFAISLVLFPPLVAQLFLRARSVWLVDLAQQVINLFQNQLFYGIIYFAFVFIFTYFYTAIIFQPDQIAENLQKQGAFIPGIRPGVATQEYLNYVMNRIVLVGALFLGLIAVLPIAMQQATNTSTFAIGGTSLLIVVSVVIDIVNQVKAQVSMREYDR
jgi:preprotein translocase subunit SecY